MVEHPDQATLEQLTKAITALLFASDKPLSARAIIQLFESAQEAQQFPSFQENDVDQALERIQSDILPPLGLMLGKAAGGFRILTQVEFAPLVGLLYPTKKVRFSPAAMETLAIIAYRQPCTRSDVESVRGVDCGGMLRNLLERSLIRIIGQKDEPGRPLIYATTEEFLKVFSLDSLNELPPLRQIENLSDESNFRSELLADIEPEVPHSEESKADSAQLAFSTSLESTKTSAD